MKVLAKYIRKLAVPSRFYSCRLIAVEVTGLNKDRLDLLVKHAKATDKTTILFFDDFHRFLADSKEAGSLLKDILAEESLHCILATTPAKYMQFTQNNEALGSQLQQVLVKEPPIEETISILNALKPRCEAFHGVHISEDAVISSAILAASHLTWRTLPESAVDLMDEAAATVAVVVRSEPAPLRTLESKRAQLETEIDRLENNRDNIYEPHLTTAKSELTALKEQIGRLRKQNENTKRRQQLIKTKVELEKMTEKVEYATWNQEWDKVLELERYMIPNLKKQITALELKKAEAGDSEGDVVGRDEIRGVVYQWIKDRDQPVAQINRSSIRTQTITHQLPGQISGPANAQIPRTSDFQASSRSSARTQESSDDQVLQQPPVQTDGSSDVQVLTNIATTPVSNSIPLTQDLNGSKNIPKVRKRDRFRNFIGSISSLFHHDKDQYRKKDAGFPAKTSDKTLRDDGNKKVRVLPVVRSSTTLKQGQMKQAPALSAAQSNVGSKARAQQQPSRDSDETSGSKEVIRFLKANNFSVDRIDFKKDKTLIWAAENGHEAVARYLILEHSDATDDNARMDALCGAAKGGHTSIIGLFLDLGFVDVNRKYCSLTTHPLHEVVKCGDEACIKRLLEAGADVTTVCRPGQTALHLATVSRNLPAMRLLLEYKALVNAVDSNGETSLHLAVRQGHTDAVKLLLDWGIRVMRQSMQGLSALHLAAQCGHEDIVQMLLEKDNANVTAGDNMRRTALHLAVINGHTNVAWMLLENGADPQAKDKSGQTSLMLAYDCGLDVFGAVP